MENNNTDNFFENILEDTINNVNESEDMPKSLRRTVWLIQDEEDDETYTADEILDDKPQSHIFDIRHSLYAAYRSGEYKFVCKQCQQPLGLKVRTHEGDFFPFFSHFQNSGLCPLKNQIEIDPIHSVHNNEKNFKSSLLYEQMIERLKEALEKSDSFENIEKNKVISKPEIKGFRRPAIYSSYIDREVCLDLLVSNPLISLLVGRNAFYKLHKMFYLWLFPSFTTKHQRLCQKDILYMNRRNVFVFDSKDFYNQENKAFCGENTNSSSHVYAYEESIRQNRLMLNCYWQIPEVSEINGKKCISIKWVGPELVAFEDLSFDFENCELYYHDSDIDFYNSYPEEIQRQIDEWIKIKKDRWVKIFDSIEKRKIQYAQLMAKRERKERLKYYYSLLEDGEAEPELYYDEESKLYGYKIDDFEIIPPTYYDAKPFYCGCAWVRKKEKWGVINYMNTRIENFQYSNIDDLGNGLFCGTKAKIKYLLNYDGKILYEKGFYSIERIDETAIKVRGFRENWLKNYWGYSKRTLEGTKYGLVDNCGKILTELRYSSILKKFSNNLFVASKDGKYGLIDNNGNEILPFDYDFIEIYNENYAKLKKGKLWGVVNANMEHIISPEFHEIVEIIQTHIQVRLSQYSNIAEVDWNGNEIYEIRCEDDIKIYHSRLLYKFGLMDETNKPITGLEFHQLKKFNNNLLIASKDGKYGLIDNNGNEILPFDYDFIEIYNDDYAKIKKGKLWGVVNANGMPILSPEFHEIVKINCGIISVRKTPYDNIGEFNLNGQEIYLYQIYADVVVYVSRIQKKCGLMNNEYQPITELIFDSINDFKKGKAIAKQGFNYGVINTKGQEIIPFKFSEIGDFVDGYAYAKIYGKGIIDEQGNEIYNYHELDDLIVYESRLLKKFGLMTLTNNPFTDLIYDQMPVFKNGIAIVSKGNKWGIINKSGDELVSFQYDDLIETKNKNFVVRKNRKWGIINSSGHIITPIKYDRIIEKGEGIYCIREESYGYWGVVNDDNTFILPIKYGAIGDFTNGYLSVKKGKWWKKIKINKSASSNKENNYIDLSKLQEDVVYNAVSTGFTKFGVFIEIPNIGIGLIPAKEIYAKEKKLNDFKKGAKIKVLLQKKDVERNRASFKLA